MTDDLSVCLEALNSGKGLVQFDHQTGPAIAENDDELVVPTEALAEVSLPGHAAILQRIENRANTAFKRAVTASLALRIGWAYGVEIAAYKYLGKLADIRSASLVFQGTLLRRVVIHDAQFSEIDGSDLNEALARILYEKTMPFIETHHNWSRLSKRAILSMMTSAWATRYRMMSEDQIGFVDEDCISEIEAFLSAHSALKKDTPDLYVIESEGRRSICQKRTLCCLYYKLPDANYCGSCPILSEEDRLSRQTKWVAEYGRLIASS